MAVGHDMDRQPASRMEDGQNAETPEYRPEIPHLEARVVFGRGRGTDLRYHDLIADGTRPP